MSQSFATGPIHFHPSTSKKTKEEHERIFRIKIDEKEKPSVKIKGRTRYFYGKK